MPQRTTVTEKSRNSEYVAQRTPGHRAFAQLHHRLQSTAFRRGLMLHESHAIYAAILHENMAGLGITLNLLYKEHSADKTNTLVRKILLTAVIAHRRCESRDGPNEASSDSGGRGKLQCPGYTLPG